MKIEDHPAYDLLVDWIKFGTFTTDTGQFLAQQKDVLEHINAQYPANQLYPTALSRLKRKVLRERGGYIVKDGRAARGDGTIITPIPLKNVLQAITSVGLEYVLEHPEKIRVQDIVEAVKILRELEQETSESDEYSKMWVAYAETTLNPDNSKGQKRKGKAKIIEAIPEVIEPPESLEQTGEV